VFRPLLSVYRERGHRRLAPRTYEEKCTTCMWGCHMAVETIIDQWNPSNRRYRTEIFCYGPRDSPSLRVRLGRQYELRRRCTCESGTLEILIHRFD
jgi:hypothetical protein